MGDTTHKKNYEIMDMVKQAQLGVPHSRIQVELAFILQAGTCQILILFKIQDIAKVFKAQN